MDENSTVELRIRQGFGPHIYRGKRYVAGEAFAAERSDFFYWDGPNQYQGKWTPRLPLYGAKFEVISGDVGDQEINVDRVPRFNLVFVGNGYFNIANSDGQKMLPKNKRWEEASEIYENFTGQSPPPRAVVEGENMEGADENFDDEEGEVI
jgi:hypothetical protein